MVSVGVRELRDNLSEYLRRVQEGELLVITDRGKPIGELGPAAGGRNAELARTLVRKGVAAGRAASRRGCPRHRDRRRAWCRLRSSRTGGDLVPGHEQPGQSSTWTSRARPTCAGWWTRPRSWPRRSWRTRRRAPRWLDGGGSSSLTAVAHRRAKGALEADWPRVLALDVSSPLAKRAARPGGASSAERLRRACTSPRLCGSPRNSPARGCSSRPPTRCSNRAALRAAPSRGGGAGPSRKPPRANARRGTITPVERHLGKRHRRCADSLRRAPPRPGLRRLGRRRRRPSAPRATPAGSSRRLDAHPGQRVGIGGGGPRGRASNLLSRARSCSW